MDEFYLYINKKLYNKDSLESATRDERDDLLFLLAINYSIEDDPSRNRFELALLEKEFSNSAIACSFFYSIFYNQDFAINLFEKYADVLLAKNEFFTQKIFFTSNGRRAPGFFKPQIVYAPIPRDYFFWIRDSFLQFRGREYEVLNMLSFFFYAKNDRDYPLLRGCSEKLIGLAKNDCNDYDLIDDLIEELYDQKHARIGGFFNSQGDELRMFANYLDDLLFLINQNNTAAARKISAQILAERPSLRLFR